MTALMSTSLKVVSMAAVSCASLRRLAIVWRSRDMRTRSSRAASPEATGAPGGGGALSFRARVRSASAAFATSSLSTCPRRPEPITSPVPRSDSTRSLRAAGEGGISSMPISWRGLGSRSSFLGSVGGAGTLTGAAAAGIAAPSPIVPRTAPTATVSPDFTAISARTPDAGAGTSTVTLSVSSSTRGSSAATASPACLNHWPTVASTTDSPKLGTLISVAIGPSFRLAKRLFEQPLQLMHMLFHQARRCRRRARPPGIADALVARADMVEHPFEVRLDEAPGAHVLRLLLAPYHLSVLEAAKLMDQGAGGEGIKLLDSEQIDVVQPALLALIVEIVIDLAGADDHAADGIIGRKLDDLAGQELGIVPQEAMEARAGAELGQGRDHALVTKQRFRRHQDEGLAELAVELAPQDVKIIRGRGAVRDLPVVLGAELEIALEPRRGMFRPLALIAMRQQEDEPRHAEPFALARGNELIDDDLRAVGEIAELRFPQHERVRLGEAVPVLEAEHGLFRQHRVDDFERRLAFGQVLERGVFLLVLLVHQHGMALGEGAALGVLAREPDAEALDEQRAVSERLGGGPIDPLAVLDHLAARRHDADNGLVRGKGLGERGELAADFAQDIECDAGIAAPRPFLGMADAGPSAVEPIGAVRPVAFAGRELLFEQAAELGLHGVDLVPREQVFGDELPRVDFDRARMLGDAPIHQGLGEGGLVGLVVAEAPVAEHVDDDRLAEALAVLRGDLGDIDHGLGIVAIHVKDRRIDHLGDVGGVGRGARKARRGRETDLIVDDEMQRAAGTVSAQPGKAETLRDHALPGESGIAMQEERQDFFALPVAALILLGADLAKHHGIDDLEMRGVRRERQMHAVQVELAV